LAVTVVPGRKPGAQHSSRWNRRVVTELFRLRARAPRRIVSAVTQSVAIIRSRLAGAQHGSSRDLSVVRVFSFASAAGLCSVTRAKRRVFRAVTGTVAVILCSLTGAQDRGRCTNAALFSRFARAKGGVPGAVAMAITIAFRSLTGTERGDSFWRPTLVFQTAPCSVPVKLRKAIVIAMATAPGTPPFARAKRLKSAALVQRPRSCAPVKLQRITATVPVTALKTRRFALVTLQRPAALAKLKTRTTERSLLEPCCAPASRLRIIATDWVTALTMRRGARALRRKSSVTTRRFHRELCCAPGFRPGTTVTAKATALKIRHSVRVARPRRAV
jgi:hypothetical protein